MASKEQALHSFWSSFGIPAYDENSVPTGDNAPSTPYITYQAIFDNMYGGPVSMLASIWYRSSSWSDITAKCNDIRDYISIGGRVISIDRGYLWIKRGSPFAQRMSDNTDDTIRRVVINISVEYLTEN